MRRSRPGAGRPVAEVPRVRERIAVRIRGVPAVERHGRAFRATGGRPGVCDGGAVDHRRHSGLGCADTTVIVAHCHVDGERAGLAGRIGVTEMERGSRQRQRLVSGTVSVIHRCRPCVRAGIHEGPVGRVRLTQTQGDIGQAADHGCDVRYRRRSRRAAGQTAVHGSDREARRVVAVIGVGMAGRRATAGCTVPEIPGVGQGAAGRIRRGRTAVERDGRALDSSIRAPRNGDRRQLLRCRSAEGDVVDALGLAGRGKDADACDRLTRAHAPERSPAGAWCGGGGEKAARAEDIDLAGVVAQIRHDVKPDGGYVADGEIDEERVGEYVSDEVLRRRPEEPVADEDQGVHPGGIGVELHAGLDVARMEADVVAGCVQRPRADGDAPVGDTPRLKALLREVRELLEERGTVGEIRHRSRADISLQARSTNGNGGRLLAGDEREAEE